jgi:hypothetical protein
MCSTKFLCTILFLNTACASDINSYSTPLGQARQFIETCGTFAVESNLFTFRLLCCFCPGSQKKNILALPNINEYLTSRQYKCCGLWSKSGIRYKRLNWNNVCVVLFFEHAWDKFLHNQSQSYQTLSSLFFQIFFFKLECL